MSSAGFDYETGPNNLNVISKKTLKKIAPQAMKAAAADLDPEDLDYLWVMLEKPVPVGEGDDIDQEEWTQTNEPELAEWLSSAWDDVAVNVNGRQVVILCGSYDDEYGRFWNDSAGRWEHYAF